MFIKDTSQYVFYFGNIVSEIILLYDTAVYKPYNISYYRKDIKIKQYSTCVENIYVSRETYIFYI